MEAKGFLIYSTYSNQFKMLDDAELGALIRALMLYFESGEVMELSPMAQMLFSVMKDNLDRDRQRYQDVCDKRREAIQSRWNKQKEADTNVYKSIQMDTNGYKAIQTDTKHTNINVNVNDNVNVNVNSNSKSNRFTIPNISDIEAYCREKGYKDFDAEYFWNYYESKGWKVGSTKMKNWHSAVANWHKNDVARRKQKGSNMMEDLRRLYQEG